MLLEDLSTRRLALSVSITDLDAIAIAADFGSHTYRSLPLPITNVNLKR